MKKALLVLLVVASSLSFLLAYSREERVWQARTDQAEARVGREFQIPADTVLADPRGVYPLLRDAARESGANVFRSGVRILAGDRVEEEKFVLLTGATRYFDSFSLAAGRWLIPADMGRSGRFVSTLTTGSPRQVGTATSFGGSARIVFKPLSAAYDSLPTAGAYFAEAPPGRFRLFLDRLAAGATVRFGPNLRRPLTADDFRPRSTTGGGARLDTGASRLDGAALLGLLVLSAVLVAYSLFYESRRIGVMRMHGVAPARVWFLVLGRLLCLAFVLSLVVTVAAAACIPGAPPQFVGGAALAVLRVHAVLAAASVLAYAYIRRLKVSDTVKNREDTRGIFVVNTLLKLGCSVALLLVAVSVWGQYAEVRARREAARNWARSKDYGVFYPLNVGEDTDIGTGSLRLWAAIAGGLYPVLDARGALYVDAAEYESGQATTASDDPCLRSLQVNPNYLRAYPLLDSRGRRVLVQDSTVHWILLVPDRYRGCEGRLVASVRALRAEARRIERVDFGREVPAALRRQRVKIVWLASGQGVFSFDPLVPPGCGNLIADPVIQVMTVNNSLTSDRLGAIKGGGPSDALKMRLLDQNPRDTLTRLEPVLRRLGLDDNIRYLVTVDQVMLREAADLQRAASLAVLAGAAVLALLAFLVAQNLVILFHRYQRAFVIRRVFGAGFARTYREELLSFGSLWVLQVLACAAAVRFAGTGGLPGVAGDGGAGRFAAVAAVLMAGELAASVAVIRALERRAAVPVIKGGV